MKSLLCLLAPLGLVGLLSAVHADMTFDPREIQAGGAATTAVLTARAFSQFPPRLGFVEQGHFRRGDHIFRRSFPGLGPLFNAQSCQSCHLHDGRGHPPASADEPMVSMFLRLSVDGTDNHGGPRPEPIYGGQLQTFGLDGPTHGEAHSQVSYEEITGHYAEGTPYTLQRPVYAVRALNHGPFAPDVRFSPRVAPPVFGLGLIEAIAEADLLAHADPDDADGDGISGRPNRVWDAVHGRPAIGRFGYKAGSPSLLQQIAGAFRGDMGITNPVFPDELCTDHQAACRRDAAAEAKQPNATALDLALVEFYNRHLAVPPRRDADHPTVLQGKSLFSAIGCAGCHQPQYTTGDLRGSAMGDVRGAMLAPSTEHSPLLATLSGQTIWPYSDFLLHDLGGDCEPVKTDGETWWQRCDGLADGRPEHGATGREWRTAPLWGLGLTKIVNPRARFLHDGRARTPEEAILWHGGEADGAKTRFTQLSAGERAALLRFLDSL